MQFAGKPVLDQRILHVSKYLPTLGDIVELQEVWEKHCQKILSFERAHL
jgi:hypothetical protein